ncbi:EcsC family protein [Catellatospora sichuanensis]|uniref:EcsC family protein n=1 Tax=Catellatospora sichuanensis TaxID=1969805 RepID=UPI00118379F8|nr:EcsC family protein [Catellatospora sichuanensis]
MTEPGALAPADSDLDVREAPPPGLWQRMKADPQYAPEHLALEAVTRIGPQAAAWVARMRTMYPNMHPDGLAQLAVKRFRRHARFTGAVSGSVGLPGAIADLATLAWTQSRLVLHLAAVYGVDPTHPDRATDLLVLQRVHKATEAARLALGVAQGREGVGAALAKGVGTTASRAPVGRALGRLSWKLAQMAGMRAVRKVAAKAIPFAAIVFGAWANSSTVNDLASRTINLYRPPALTAVPHPRPASQ